MEPSGIPKNLRRSPRLSTGIEEVEKMLAMEVTLAVKEDKDIPGEVFAFSTIMQDSMSCR